MIALGFLSELAFRVSETLKTQKYGRQHDRFAGSGAFGSKGIRTLPVRGLACETCTKTRMVLSAPHVTIELRQEVFHIASRVEPYSREVASLQEPTARTPRVQCSSHKGTIEILSSRLVLYINLCAQTAMAGRQLECRRMCGEHPGPVDTQGPELQGLPSVQGEFCFGSWAWYLRAAAKK